MNSGDRNTAADDDLAAAIGQLAADDGTFPHDVGFVINPRRQRATMIKLRRIRVTRTRYFQRRIAAVCV